ncbi:hypothetical protein WJX84_012358 [Apatococcus fuscideae]|uniref:Uncharacterized protein n=1 Tax=Apatococcus fuscideae TaxID=2026836 RepID=A0AAW1SR96_9CHLO
MHQGALPDFLSNGTAHTNRRSTRRGNTTGLQTLANANAACGALLAIFGVTIIMTCASLHDAARMTGMVLGVTAMLSGTAGAFAAFQRLPSLIILSGLAALVTIMLSFTFLEQVQAGVKTDCAIAELMLRSEGARKMADEARHIHKELFDAVYVRLHELEGAAEARQATVDKRVKLRHEQSKLQDLDASYIILSAGAKDAQLLQRVPQETAAVVACLVVLEKIAEHKQAPDLHHSVQFQEFEELVSLLLDEHQQPSTHAPAVDTSILKQTARELPNFEGALHRSKEGEYHKNDIKGLMTELEEHQQVLARDHDAKRRSWNKKFQDAIHHKLLRQHRNFLQAS